MSVCAPCAAVVVGCSLCCACLLLQSLCYHNKGPQQLCYDTSKGLPVNVSELQCICESSSKTKMGIGVGWLWGWIACIYVIPRANINLNLKLSVKWEELISYWLLLTGKHSQKAVYLALSGRKREACSFVSHSIPQLHPSLRKWSRNGFNSLADMIAACRGQKSVFLPFLKVCHILEK